MCHPRTRATFRLLGLVTLRAAVLVGAATLPVARADEGRRPLLFVHVMPWYEAPPVASGWGWHWTMNRFDPDRRGDGRPSIASHYTPAIGPYDSADGAVIEYQTLSMRVAGIDGIVVDWYGREEFRDWAVLHRATTRIVAGAERAGLSFAVCYEDQTVPALEEAGRLPAGGRVDHAVAELGWLAAEWFPKPAYARLDGKPLLLSFGQTGLDDAEWSRVLERTVPVAYLSEHRRRGAATGAFDWPLPSAGLAATRDFAERARNWPRAMPVAFPRFHDIYAEAGVQESHGAIADADGATFRRTLDAALADGAAIVQVATWNDWGEGTQIEPSREFGVRDLVVIQEARRRADPGFPWDAADLEIPFLLLAARRRGGDSAALDRIAAAIVAGDAELARRLTRADGE